jgi:hypothetical protein
MYPTKISTMSTAANHIMLPRMWAMSPIARILLLSVFGSFWYVIDSSASYG